MPGIFVLQFTNCSLLRVASKDEAAEEGKKKKGGIQIPEEWPWQEAKKFFEKPDVTPADEVEVRTHDERQSGYYLNNWCAAD